MKGLDCQLHSRPIEEIRTGQLAGSQPAGPFLCKYSMKRGCAGKKKLLRTSSCYYHSCLLFTVMYILAVRSTKHNLFIYFGYLRIKMSLHLQLFTFWVYSNGKWQLDCVVDSLSVTLASKVACCCWCYHLIQTTFYVTINDPYHSKLIKVSHTEEHCNPLHRAVLRFGEIRAQRGFFKSLM